MLDPLLAKYDVRARIGRGTHGKVHRAIEVASGAARAVMFVQAEAKCVEAEILKRLAHPHVVPLLEFFAPARAAGRADAALVFPERETDLGRFLARRRGESHGPCVIAGQAIGARTVARWSSHLSGALAFLHAQSLVHRDVKPGNVLLKWNPTGSFDAELADVGMARVVPEVDVRRGRLREKAAVDARGRALQSVAVAMTPHCCTLPYAAPEIWFGGWADGASKYGYASDIWSLGTVVFEMATLEMFVMGNSDAARVASVVHRLRGAPEGPALGQRQQAIVKAAEQVEVRGSAPSSGVCRAGPRGNGEGQVLWGHLIFQIAWEGSMRHMIRCRQRRLPWASSAATRTRSR